MALKLFQLKRYKSYGPRYVNSLVKRSHNIPKSQNLKGFEPLKFFLKFVLTSPFTLTDKSY